MIQQFYTYISTVYLMQTWSHTKTYRNVHSSISQNRQNVQTTQMSINWKKTNGYTKCGTSRERTIIRPWKWTKYQHRLWHELWNIMVSERRQSPETTYHRTPFTRNVHAQGKSTGAESRLSFQSRGRDMESGCWWVWSFWVMNIF